MMYIMDITNEDGSPIKLTPKSKFLHITIEAETDEEAISQGTEVATNFLGPDYVFNVSIYAKIETE